MNKTDLSPLFVALFYILRCLVPLGIMLGISYLLRRFGLIRETPHEPADWENGNDHKTEKKGDMVHG